jgi:hypothetical protein
LIFSQTLTLRFRNNYDIVYARQSLSSLPSNIINIRTNPLSTEEYISSGSGGDIGFYFMTGKITMPLFRRFAECLSAGMLLSCLQVHGSRKNFSGIITAISLQPEISYLYPEYKHSLIWRSSSSNNVNPIQNGYLSFADANNGACTSFVIPTGVNSVISLLCE